jgi:hypothetical protein
MRVTPPAAGLALLVCLGASACGVDPLGALGRPCTTDAACGPGTVCDPASQTCVRPISGADAFPADVGDLGPDSALFDSGGKTDQHSWADLGPGCSGSCPLGCNSPAGRCYRLQPSTFDVSGFYDMVSQGLVASASELTFDTDTGGIRDGSVVIRPAGQPGNVVNGIYWSTVIQGAGLPEISVFGLASLDVPSGVAATILGSRAFALYATGNVTIQGKLSAPASGQQGGPGGFAGGLKNGAAGQICFGGQGRGGLQGGSAGNQAEAGGGGGGRGAAGGKGGDSTFTPYPPGGAGGSAVGAASLVPLFGGCGGGAGGGPDTYSPPGDGGYGGGGGGAIQLAASGEIVVGGVITAPGAGGEGGHYGAAGGGGGSGGAILLEAAKITVSGLLAANGGGGGSGSGAVTFQNAPNGSDGLASSTRAPGGASVAYWGGGGGQGGALLPQSGAAGQENANGGGGGGAAGSIRFNAPSITAAPGTASPAAIQSTMVATW